MTQSRFSCWLRGQSKGALGGLAMGQQLAVWESGSWITGPFSALVHGLKSLITSDNSRLLQLLDASEWEHWKDYGCFYDASEHWKDYLVPNWSLANLSQKHISAIKPEMAVLICHHVQDLAARTCKGPWLAQNIYTYESEKSRTYYDEQE